VASIIAVDLIQGVTNSSFVTLPVGVADGATITFTTIANRSVLTLANQGIQLSHLSPAVLQQVTAQSSVSLPATIIQKVGKSSPPGTLACTGQAVSRTTYSALFAEIGTSYGAGDGVSTFNVPNFGGNYYIKY
jgi:phage-related tail fiber protein